MSERSVGAPGKVVLAIRRHPKRAALIGAAVVVVAVLGAIVLGGGGDDDPDDSVASESSAGADDTAGATDDSTASSASAATSSVAGRTTTTSTGTTTSAGSSTSTSLAAGARTFDVNDLPAATCRVEQALATGSSGDAVECLQARLNAAMTSGAELAVDGAFGPATDRAVREFQTSKSLVVDGIAGQQTLDALGIAEDTTGATTTTSTTVAGDND